MIDADNRYFARINDWHDRMHPDDANDFCPDLYRRVRKAVREAYRNWDNTTNEAQYKALWLEVEKEPDND